MEIVNPIAAVTPSKATLSKAWKIFLWIAGLALVGGFIYWYFFLGKISWSEVKRLISLESAKYPGKEVVTEQILLQGAQEILSHPHLAKEARLFAADSKIAMERVVVDNAIAMAKNLGYIPANAPAASSPPKTQ